MPGVVVVAGPSGSGKSHLVDVLGWTPLRLDDFYREIDEPGLPMSSLGIPDWDDPRSWDHEAALAAIRSLCSTGRAEVPEYDIALSRRTGSRELIVEGQHFIAEGLFANEVLAVCREEGLLTDAIVLARPRLVTFWLRLTRDLREARKSPLTLVRRGWRLLRDDSRIIAEAVAAGCRPLAPRRARAALRALGR